MSNVQPKMYLILREDLAYKYIQGGHALAQLALDYPSIFKEWNNEHLICLSVFDGRKLKDKQIEILRGGLTCSSFIEPDLQSSLPTAIAIFENGTGEVSKYLSTLQLASK